MHIIQNVVGLNDNNIFIDIANVYIRNNIKKLENGLYQYDEIQYTKDEYIELLSKEKDELEKQLTDSQLAITEIFELVGGEYGK